MKPLFRRMTTDDVQAVADLEKTIFKDAWSYWQFMSELDGSHYKFPLLLEVQDQLAGYAIVWAFYDEVHLNNFAIHPAWRRKGLGMKFLCYILDMFSDYQDIFLEVRSSNSAARALYERAGFDLFARRKGFYSDGEDALVMHKPLKPTAEKDNGLV